MSALLHRRDGARTRLGQVLLDLDALPLPRLVDDGDELRQRPRRGLWRRGVSVQTNSIVLCNERDLWVCGGAHVDPIVVVVDDDRDVELLAHGHEVIEVVAQLWHFEDDS